MSRLRSKPLEGAEFGVEIVGFDPSRITEDDMEAVRQLNQEAHGLLCFSFNRHLSGEELHALTGVFGESEFAPGLINGLGKQAAPGEEHLTLEEQLASIRQRGEDPYLCKMGNMDESTFAQESVDPLFFGEWEWHSDMSYIEVPPTFSLLHARVVPGVGGDTGFCDQVAAAADLPTDLRDRVKSIRVKHDSTYGSDGTLRPGMTHPASPIEAIGYPHPVIREIPESGEAALYLGRRTNAYVMGMDLEDSERLLDEVWAHATQPQYCYRHHWQVGQVVVWDNRRLMHKRYPMDEQTTRFMWRTQTKGELVRPAAV